MMTTTTQEVTMMVLTIQKKTSKTTRKQTTMNLHETLMPALKTWMNRPNRYPVGWKVWMKTRKRNHLNESLNMGDTHTQRNDKQEIRVLTMTKRTKARGM